MSFVLCLPIRSPTHREARKRDQHTSAAAQTSTLRIYKRLTSIKLENVLTPNHVTETFHGLKNNELKNTANTAHAASCWRPGTGMRHWMPSLHASRMRPSITRREGLNRFLFNPAEDKLEFDGGFEEKTYLARLSHAENAVPSNDDRPRTFLRFEAFSEGWFQNNPPPDGEIPWADEDAFLRYYAAADLYQLELETISDHGELFQSLSAIRKHTVEGYEPADWFRIRVAEPRGNVPITEVVPLQLFQNLLTEGTALALADIKPVDEKTRKQLDRAVSTQHIASVGGEELKGIFQDVINRQIDWVVVYDVGQGNAIGLCDQTGGVSCYVDLGGGSGANLRTFPPALQAFCFTQCPPIILTHWDEDHWSSGLRDRRALAQRWIAPRQRMGGIQMAFVAAIISAGGRVLFVNGNMPPTRLGQLQLELCTGTGRNHSGIAVTLYEDTQDGNRRMLFPGDADYRYIPSFNTCGYVSVVTPHHGGPLQRHTAPPRSPQQSESRLVYSYGPNNTYQHPVLNTRAAHDAAGWRDNAVNPPGVEVRETANRGKNGLGHVLLGWQVHGQPPPLPCGGQCHLRAQQV